jgi:hypothetical protein
MDYFYNVLVSLHPGVYGNPDEKMVDKEIRYFGQHGIGEYQEKTRANVILAEFVQRVDELGFENFLYSAEVHGV